MLSLECHKNDVSQCILYFAEGLPVQCPLEMQLLFINSFTSKEYLTYLLATSHSYLKTVIAPTQ